MVFTAVFLGRSFATVPDQVSRRQKTKGEYGVTRTEDKGRTLLCEKKKQRKRKRSRGIETRREGREKNVQERCVVLLV